MTQRSEPLRVCLVAQQWSPRFSGAALRFRQYLPGLRELGVEVNVLCATPPDASSRRSTSLWADLREGGVLPPENIEGTHVFRVKLPEGRSWRRNMLFRNAIIDHLSSSRAAVAQFLTLEPLRAIPRSGFGRGGARCMFTGTLLPALSERRFKRLLQRAWIRFPIQNVDHLVVSSGVMRHFYESLGVTIPISVIPNGVDLERFRSVDSEDEKQSARARLGLSPDARVVVFVGSIIERKGVDLLLAAFTHVAAENRAAELILVGPRDDSRASRSVAFDRRVGDLVRCSGASERIHFTGFVNDVDLYLRAADIFVLPSQREGMGNVVLEAMAMGIPAILTPYLGLPGEFGTPGEEYVLSMPNVESLANHIQDLLGHSERRRAIGRAGRRWVEKHMDMAVVIDTYARIYRELASHGRIRTDLQAVS